MKTLLILLFSLASLVGCAANSPTPPAPPQVTTTPGQKRIDFVLWSPDMAPFVSDWLEETARRYDDAVVVFCHGGDIDHEWKMQPSREFGSFPIAAGIRVLRATYGSRQLVLVTCNPGGYPLPANSGKVAYLRAGFVWLTPWTVQRRKGTADVFDLAENR